MAAAGGKESWTAKSGRRVEPTRLTTRLTLITGHLSVASITPQFRKLILVRQVSPHVVEVAVPGCTRGIVTLTAEEPELAKTVDKGRRIAAAAGCPDVVGLIGTRQIAVTAVLAAGVRSLNPGPRPG